jgi:hypothetical protein
MIARMSAGWTHAALMKQHCFLHHTEANYFPAAMAARCTAYVLWQAGIMNDNMFFCICVSISQQRTHS